MGTDSLISTYHQQLYRDYYAGREVISRPSVWLTRVEDLVKRFDAKSILDYGCGAARGLSKYSRFAIADYDPGVVECSALPERADLVVCLHTVEHVEPASVEAVLEHLKSLAIKALFLVICCEDSTKLLPDGSAWHSFVRDAAWWQAKLVGFEPQPVIHDRPGAEYAALWTAV